MDGFLWLAYLLIALGVWAGPLWRPRPLPGVTRERPLAIGHRGVRGSLPENTMAAFRAALDAGLDGIETDVQRTRDGALVLVHDPVVAGLRVTDVTLDELRAALPDVATLTELIELMRAHPGTLLNVELKTLDPGGPTTAMLAAELFGRVPNALARDAAAALQGSGLEDRLVVSSFSAVTLFHLRRHAPNLRTAYLWSAAPPPGSAEPGVPWPWNRPWPAGLLHADALHPRHDAATPDAVARWRARGLLVNVWTVNDAADVARVMAAGVDGVMGDDPPALLHAMGRGDATP